MSSEYPPQGPYPPPGYYPQQQPPPGYYPPQQPPAPGYYPPQQQPPPGYYPPPSGYAPPQQQPPPGYYPPQQGDQYDGRPIVIPIVGTGAARIAAFAKRTITVTPDGFAVASKKSAGWQVWWQELRRVVITTAYHQSPRLGSGPVYRVRLVLDAADPYNPSFVARHPDFRKAEGQHGGTGQGSFGVALGPVENIVAPLSAVMSRYGRGVFQGVVDEGQVLGFGYL